MMGVGMNYENLSKLYKTHTDIFYTKGKFGENKVFILFSRFFV